MSLPLNQKKSADSFRYSESVLYLSRSVHDVQWNVIAFQFKVMSVDWFWIKKKHT